MKMRNKGKVHPYTASASSSSTTEKEKGRDSLSVLKLLPTAILALVSFLSLEDREVLAYLIARSLSTKTNKSSKKQCSHNSPALFDCDCFHCYTSFWFRWDSSPNRELIHKAIEAFEDHLNSGESFKSSGKSKRRERFGRRRTEKLGGDTATPDSAAAESPENLERAAATEVGAAAAEVDEVELRVRAEEDESIAAAEAPAVVVRSHKGLARKVLPDVMGIFSSRLWSLWSPNV